MPLPPAIAAAVRILKGGYTSSALPCPGGIVGRKKEETKYHETAKEKII